ncbi:M23 family metallopeptidase [Psychroflexus montanilacus]|uniref:M23 family metallopeptidase n=1 Tax=Psychroflexus montanilacus TaxID=2873598 RepID=UPI001CCEA8CA|nr:M23 family metallopeptidase [Psychroflexus montanilacus]MBZ9651373.1 M23 family metallopeptidase [Psychroflexus montanilacus]
MSKVKYYYDSETLSYRKIEPKKGKNFALGTLFLLGIIATSFVLALVYLNIPNVETPKEKAYKREIENMKFQYELLNKRMEDVVDVLENVEDRDNNIYRVYFEANPISEEQRRSGFGGINRYKNLEGFENSEIITETTKNLDQLAKRLVIQSKSLDEIAALAKNKEALLASIPAIQPVKNDDLKRMASGFGIRMHPILKYRKMHNGMDFSAPSNTEVFATGNATVKKARKTSGFGNLIVLDHGFGYETYYAHLNEFNVRPGQKVKRGEIIGYVGNSGLSTAPHLHYEVHKNGKVVNPINFYHGDLTAEEYDIMLNQSTLENQSLD